MSARRLLLVHAHPDDESITTGATMAHYAASGVEVTLVTCTLGEEGEILVPELAELEAAEADQLGGARIAELEEATRALGVRDHRFLGAAGRFRDSGMMGAAANTHSRAFWRAATDPVVFDAAVAAAVGILREVRPQVVVTYDDNGDYGHPDHVMAHRVTTAAVTAAGDPAYGVDEPWSVSKVYWTATPKSDLRDDATAVTARPGLGFEPLVVDELPFGVEDDVITTTIDASDALEAKAAALRAHRTQITVAEDFFALSNNLGRAVRGIEHFRLVSAPPAGRAGAVETRERDLFAGIDP